MQCNPRARKRFGVCVTLRLVFLRECLTAAPRQPPPKRVAISDRVPAAHCTSWQVTIGRNAEKDPSGKKGLLPCIFCTTLLSHHRCTLWDSPLGCKPKSRSIPSSQSNRTTRARRRVCLSSASQISQYVSTPLAVSDLTVSIT
jgi:hypothetical protein